MTMQVTSTDNLEVVWVLRDNQGVLCVVTDMDPDDRKKILHDYNVLATERGEPLAELVETFHRVVTVERVK